MSNLNLKGIWIPIEILIDDNLSDKEKLIYSIILFLSKENNYCYCNNSSLSELLNISTTQVSKLINSLKKKECIDIIIKYKENRNEIQETYNQFVWIPVENEKDYIRNTTYREENISKTAYGDNYYLPDGIQPIIDNSDSNEQAEKEAVLGIGGFYISRYEAGTENNSLVSKKIKMY